MIYARTVERFWAQVEKTAGGGCWIWRGHRIRDGYGRLWALGTQRLAHRLSFYFAHGRWPEPQCLHKCDNPPCVNPDHLFEGTPSENMRDCARKGRRVYRGERNANSKLSPEDVLAIRASTGTLAATAAQYGIAYQHVRNIRRRKAWSHLQ